MRSLRDKSETGSDIRHAMTQGTLSLNLPRTMSLPQSEMELAGVCVALIAGQSDIPASERHLAGEGAISEEILSMAGVIRKGIVKGSDPLGDAFTVLRSPSERRPAGAVYTPALIVNSMIAWLKCEGSPGRIVDPGAGSGRYILAAGDAFPQAELIAIENDPLGALMLRANVCVRGWIGRTEIVTCDYREVELPPIEGRTAFIGNPPYVRHHDISEKWKSWYSSRFATLGIKASSLAGLHLHFFLKTLLLAKKGDFGAFITSSEWLSVNYGSALRRLLLGELGGLSLHVLDPSVEAFPGTATTAAITCFRVGETAKPLRFSAVSERAALNGLTSGTPVARKELEKSTRWSAVMAPVKDISDGEIELGEVFRVHRGQVTGANHIWIAGPEAAALPERVRIPTITKAKELIGAGALLDSPAMLRRVVDLPLELEDFTEDERKRIDAFLDWATRNGGDQSYIARHRKAWWSVGLRGPAPILCTYMARRPPQFTFNACGARHINIAHGLYPREPIASAVMKRLLVWLNANVRTGDGRVYAGGLTKFEPKEIERLRIPNLEEFA